MRKKIRRIGLPINLKLIGFTLSLLALALGFYVYYAIELFKSDKIAYVFESVSLQNAQVAQSLENKLNSAKSVTAYLQETGESSNLAREVFSKNPYLMAYIYRQAKGAIQYALPLDSALDGEKLKAQLSNVIKSEQGSIISQIGPERALIVWDKIGTTIWALDYLKSSFPESDLYGYGLLLGADSLFGSKETDAYVASKDRIEQTFNYSAHNKKLIISVAPFSTDGKVYTTADYDKALLASAELRGRSLFFGLFVAGAVIILALFFSRFFTRPIESLYEASKKFGSGEFGHRVQVKSADELGALGDSFNSMASDIEHYMGQMKEKHRLENELKTAQLVQESFFPSDFFESQNAVMKAYYRPASECGGDWYGRALVGANEIVILADVTGHGTAAALVTAVLHNSLVAIKAIAIKDPEFAASPSRIMSYLNASLLGVEVNLFATAFVIVRDIKSGRASYSNASHNPPYRLPGEKLDSLTKRDFEPLMNKIGPRLGESEDSHYEDVELKFLGRDKIIIYTDGIQEMEGPEGKAYGNRKFNKVIAQNAACSASELLQEILDDAMAFAAGVEPKDDITLICLESKPS